MDRLLDFWRSELWPAFSHWSGRLITAGLILLIGLWLARHIALLVRRAIDKRGGDAVLANFLRRTVFTTLAVVVVIGALDRAGVPTGSMLAALGAAGLTIGLALKDSLGNLASGVLLVVTRPFRAGDSVEAGGKQGTVERIDLLQTVLITADNAVVSVPNAQVMSQPIINFTARPSRRLELLIAIAADEDPRKALTAIDAALRDNERVLRDPAPQIAIVKLTDGGLELAVRPWVRTGELVATQSEVLAAIRHALHEAQVRLAAPRALKAVVETVAPRSASARSEVL